MTDAAPLDTETELARAPCALLDREMIVALHGDYAVVRIEGKGETAKYTGFAPEAALRLGAAMIRAALRLAPELSLQAVEADLDRAKLRHLRAVEAEARDHGV